ncbi:Putative hemolysin [Roseivivax lentus]|uniref:Putative hemolysin n=1 Tax=Roseivivax lentus TaxID=633194 RepID=A0A1N7KEE9_9RHOB|nr:lysophospholipid acyltransferase family protein [Roseivivax lentus]SIS59844.1 Putative hemolysin [Roseivivax lentus]
MRPESLPPTTGSHATSETPTEVTPVQAPYDKRKLSYANTFTNPWKANTIRAMEWMTGKLALLRMVRRFERLGLVEGQAFWARALEIMGIDIETPAREIARIPATGPVVVVANHPHGLVDGMVLAEIIGRRREDYRILTRSLLTGVDEVAHFMIPVPFPHEPDARQQSLKMRAEAMDHLSAGGLIAVFPSGVVASSDRAFGPAIERDWNPFTAKMIQRSGATVVPIRFPGQNSRAYQIANRVSPTLRQGLLLHEVVAACRKPQAPIVGHPLDPDALETLAPGGRDLCARLRDLTLALGR